MIQHRLQIWRAGALRLALHFRLAFLLVALTALTACGAVRGILSVDLPVERLMPRVIAVYPHDPDAFTEGLLLANGRLYESTGRYGQSSLREVDPETGGILRSVRLRDDLFGEGIALVGSRIIQLTWVEGVALRYDLDSFSQIDEIPYSAEGWGMCYDGASLYTSDGSPAITRRDADTLAALDSVTVVMDGQPVEEINELECVGDSIYANVWHTRDILRIDKASGRVTALIDTSSMLTPEQWASLSSEATLNGIAYDADSGTFLVTGKLWSWLFEVDFVPQAAPGDGESSG